MTFVFLHLGSETLIPTLLARSIRFNLPDAEIIQCADRESPAIDGVSRVHRYDGDTGNIMMYRMQAFCSLRLTGVAAYIDSDMLLNAPFDVAGLLGENDVAVCERSYDRFGRINPVTRGVEFPEFKNKTFGEVFPYLGCFNVARGVDFWQDCLAEMQKLPERLQNWYGDQLAIRDVVGRGGYRIRKVPESRFACLPEFVDGAAEVPFLIHFKGKRRKEILTQFATQSDQGQS